MKQEKCYWCEQMYDENEMVDAEKHKVCKYCANDLKLLLEKRNAKKAEENETKIEKDTSNCAKCLCTVCGEKPYHKECQAYCDKCKENGKDKPIQDCYTYNDVFAQ